MKLRMKNNILIKYILHQISFISKVIMEEINVNLKLPMGIGVVVVVVDVSARKSLNAVDIDNITWDIMKQYTSDIKEK